MLRALGDNALFLVDGADARLVSSRGTLRSFAGAGSRDVAWLAQPPRLAVRDPRTREVALVDVDTGETQAQVAAAARGALFGFSQDGDTLFVGDGPTLVAVDGDGAATAHIHVEGAAALTGLHVARDGRRALVVAHVHHDEAQHDVVLLELPHGAERGRRTVAGPLPPQLLCDRDLARAVVVAGGALIAFAPEEPEGEALVFPDHAPDVARAWAEPSLTLVVVGAAGGGLWAHRSNGPALPYRMRGAIAASADVVVEVARDRVLTVDGGVAVLRADTGAPVSDAVGGVRRACFARGGGAAGASAVVLGDAGVLLALHDGPPRLLEGPARLVDVAAHPRGVIAVDDAGRTTVFAAD